MIKNWYLISPDLSIISTREGLPITEYLVIRFLWTKDCHGYRRDLLPGPQRLSSPVY